MQKLLTTLTIIMSSGVVVLNAQGEKSDQMLREQNEEVANKLDQVLSERGLSLTPEQRETLTNPNTTQEERDAIGEQIKQEIEIATPSDQPDPVQSGLEEQRSTSTNVDDDS